MMLLTPLLLAEIYVATMFEALSPLISEHTFAAAFIAALFTLAGVVIKGFFDHRGLVTVAKINSETTLGAKALETLTAALEVLQEENRSMKDNIKVLEGHIDKLIELILKLVKAPSTDHADIAVFELEKYLRLIGRWPR